jgi:hypothetical protein
MLSAQQEKKYAHFHDCIPLTLVFIISLCQFPAFKQKFHITKKKKENNGNPLLLNNKAINQVKI